MTDESADDIAGLPAGGLLPDASDHELFEARITAYALHQLDAAEAAEIERLLADSARSDLRRQVDEMRRLAATIRYAPDETVPARSAALRRAVLAAAAAAPKATASPPSPAAWRRAWPLLAAVGSLAAALLVAATVFFERPADRMVAMNRSPEDSTIEQGKALDLAAPQAAGQPKPLLDAHAVALEEKLAEARSRRSAPARGAMPQDKAAERETTLAAQDALRDRSRGEDMGKRAAAPAEKLRIEIVQQEEAREAGDGPGSADGLAAERQEMHYGRQTKPQGNAAGENDRDGSEQLAAAVPLAKPSKALPAAPPGSGIGGGADAETAGHVRKRMGEFASKAKDAKLDIAASSYATIRRFLTAGRLPPRDAVRIDELVNSFRYDYPQPEGDAPFSVTVDAAECPWKPGHRLVRIGLQRRDLVDDVQDTAIQIAFNPAQVASYRLLGSEQDEIALAAREFGIDRKDIGTIEAGRSVTSVYEIALVGEGTGPELLTVKLRWKQPDAKESTGLEVPLTDRGPEFEKAPADLRFAAAVAAFGMILQGSDLRGEATLPLVTKIAAGALGRDDGGSRAEFLDLVRRAESAQ